MSTERTHPTDTTLIMAMDRELAAARRGTVNDHLLGCDGCRSRLNAIEKTVAESARLYRDGTAGDRADMGVLRARVQQRMVEVRDELEGSLLFRVRRLVGPLPRLAPIGISVALGMLAWFVWLGDTGTRTFAPAAASLPVSHLTPGATATISAADLCSNSTRTRPIVVAATVRQQVLRQYRMEHVPASEYELDYLITPELGGVGDARNLWPERYDSSPWNAHVKDDLERLLSRQVCEGSIALGVAQREIATNWIEAYKKHFGTDLPIPQRAGFENDDDEIQFESPATVPASPPAGQFFVPIQVSISAQLSVDATVPISSRRASWP
jgi:anti-sigma factor RsiW